MSGGICDTRVAAKVKGKLYKEIVKAAMLFGLDTLALVKRQVAELKMLIVHWGMDRMDRIKNKHTGWNFWQS